MKLLDIITIDCIRVPTTSGEKQGVINELIDQLALVGRVQAPAQLKEAVWAREQTRTTGIGHGLAIPHGKSPGVKDPAIAIGKPPHPIDFQAIDHKPVKLVILLASPPDRTSEHIQALAHISRLMTMEDFRERMYSAANAQEMHDLIRSQEGA